MRPAAARRPDLERPPPIPRELVRAVAPLPENRRLHFHLRRQCSELPEQIPKAPPARLRRALLGILVARRLALLVEHQHPQIGDHPEVVAAQRIVRRLQREQRVLARNPRRKEHAVARLAPAEAIDQMHAQRMNPAPAQIHERAAIGRELFSHAALFSASRHTRRAFARASIRRRRSMKPIERCACGRESFCGTGTGPGL